jgi:hypothetical protein
VRYATSDGYYEEVREGQIIPAGSRSQPGALIGVGPGLCIMLGYELPRTPYRRSSQNSSSKYLGE